MTKQKILAELRMGKKPKDLAEKYGVSYVKVLAWRKTELRQREKKDLAVVAEEVPKEIITEVITKLKEEAPTQELTKNFDQIEKGLDSLKLMSEDFQRAISKSVKWADKQLSSEDLTIKDWTSISKTLTEMYSAVFSKSVTNINMINGDVNKGNSIFKAKLGV